MQYFCPNCFAKVEAETETCAACGITIPGWEAGLSYEDRLIHALGHPIDETRMGAIIALGDLGHEAAAKPLVDLAFAWPKDVWQSVEILRSLHKLPIGDGVARELARLREDHPAAPVRAIADHVYAEMFTHGRRHRQEP